MRPCGARLSRSAAEAEKGVSVMQRILILSGVVLVLAGLLWPWLVKSGLGRLPGDIIIRRDNFRFYFPIVTSLLVSAVLTFLFWLFKK